MEDEPEEVALLRMIQATPEGPERDAMIDALELVPKHYRSFFERWHFVHDAVQIVYDCWSEEGYDPSKSSYSPDIQLLIAADFGMTDIYSGGLHQFFGNPTGLVAPEMIEFFHRTNRGDAATIIQESMQFFGSEYPRAQEARLVILDAVEGVERKEFDPFYDIDDLFYEAVDNPVPFEVTAEKWLREVCGIKRLRDRG